MVEWKQAREFPHRRGFHSSTCRCQDPSDQQAGAETVRGGAVARLPTGSRGTRCTNATALSAEVSALRSPVMCQTLSQHTTPRRGVTLGG